MITHSREAKLLQATGSDLSLRYISWLIRSVHLDRVVQRDLPGPPRCGPCTGSSGALTFVAEASLPSSPSPIASAAIAGSVLSVDCGCRGYWTTESCAADRRTVSFVVVAEIRKYVQVLEVSTHQLQDVVDVENAADPLVP